MTENSSLSSPKINELSDRVSLSSVIDSVLQYIWVVFFFLVAGIVLCSAYAWLASPTYRADALIQVEDKKPVMLSGVQEIADAIGATSSPVSGEVEILRSREVITKAIAATHADIRVIPRRFPLIGGWWARNWEVSNSIAEPVLGLERFAWGGEVIVVDEFDIPEASYGDKFLLRVTGSGYELEGEDGAILVSSGRPGDVAEFTLKGERGRIHVNRLSARPKTEFIVVKDSLIDVYRRILDRLNVGEIGKQSSVIRITYLHEDVDFARDLVNAIAQAYLTQNVERRSAEADQSLKFLEQQLPEIKKNVSLAEDALNTFRTRTNTVSVEKAADSLLQRAVDAERSRLELQLKRDELRQRFRPDHPELKAIESQLAAITKNSQAINDQVGRLPQVQRDLLRLQRDVEVNNELYITLLNNAQQLKVAKAGTIGNVRVIDFAVRDGNPVAPKKIMIVTMGAFTGLLVGLAAAFVLRLLRPTVREASDVEQATGLASYASIPESSSQEKLDSSKRDKKGREAIIEGRSQLLALLQPDDAAIESLRSLRTGLAFALLGAENKNIVITGATSALGKSFVSANLSVLLASTGKRVLVVETDMRRPQLGAYFGYGKKVGLSDLLIGQQDFQDVVMKDAAGVEGLDVLPSGQIPPNPGELLLSELFAKLLRRVQDHYDYIILDSAPVLPVGDTLAVARHAATVFMVVRAERSTLKEVQDAIQKLQSAGCGVKGLIFNGIKKRRISYGYGYRYYYGYGSRN